VLLDDVEEAPFRLGSGARAPDFREGQSSATHAADPESPTRGRHSPSGHERTLGGQASPSIKSGTVA